MLMEPKSGRVTFWMLAFAIALMAVGAWINAVEQPTAGRTAGAVLLSLLVVVLAVRAWRSPRVR